MEVLFKRRPYTDTFRYVQNFKPNQIRLKDNFFNLDQILYSHTCCECVFYIRDFNSKHIALFFLPVFPPQATPKLSQLSYPDIVYTINLDAIPASYNINHIKKLHRLDEQNQQIAKQQQLTK